MTIIIMGISQVCQLYNFTLAAAKCCPKLWCYTLKQFLMGFIQTWYMDKRGYGGGVGSGGRPPPPTTTTTRVPQSSNVSHVLFLSQ